MGYQNLANLLNDASDQPSKFRTRNWVEINDELKGRCTSNDIKFKTTMLRSNMLRLCGWIRTCKGKYKNYWYRR